MSGTAFRNLMYENGCLRYIRITFHDLIKIPENTDSRYHYICRHHERLRRLAGRSPLLLHHEALHRHVELADIQGCEPFDLFGYFLLYLAHQFADGKAILKHQVHLHVDAVGMVLGPKARYPADSVEAADNEFHDLVDGIVGYGIAAEIAECRPHNGLLAVRLETQLSLAPENLQRI